MTHVLLTVLVTFLTLAVISYYIVATSAGLRRLEITLAWGMTICVIAGLAWLATS